MSVLRWILVALLAAGVLSLIIWARGTDHHRGQDVGAVRAAAAVLRMSAG